jgi:hypothetical protein
MMIVWSKHVVAITSEEEKNCCVDGPIVALLIRYIYSILQIHNYWLHIYTLIDQLFLAFKSEFTLQGITPTPNTNLLNVYVQIANKIGLKKKKRKNSLAVRRQQLPFLYSLETYPIVIHFTFLVTR